MGQLLSVLHGLPKAETLISRIRQGDYDAEAELTESISWRRAKAV